MASYNEAIEVKPEDALHDLTLFVSETEEIRNIIQQIALLKEKSPADAKAMIEELRIEGSFHFLTLKKLNRMAQIRSKNAKDATIEAKQKLDGNNLRLQNLQYEITHFDREINNCLQFKSKHEEIDLVPVEEFYAQAPKCHTMENKNDEHLEMLGRLDWELESRKKLDAEMNASHSKKDKVCEGIKKRKQDLDSLRPSLETILKSTMPLQEALGDHYTETRALHDNACLLPQPLYVLFVQAKAYADACDRDMEVQIGGDLDAATKLKNSEMRKVVDARNLYKKRDEDYSESENEEEQENTRGRRKSTAAKASSSSEPMTTSGSMAKHPLYVSLKSYLETKGDSSPYLLIRFYHYAEDEFVTAVPSLQLTSAFDNVKNSPVLKAGSLLHDLQQPDSGREIPHKHSGLCDVTLGDAECAYLWAQKLAGIEVVESRSASGTRTSFSNMRLVMKLIRRRIASRLSLAEQIRNFTSNAVRCDSSITEKYAPEVQFKLTSWKAINYESYCKFHFTAAVRDLKLARPRDYFFLTTLQRGASAKVNVVVAVSNCYPKQWPLLSVQLQWRGDHTAETNLNLREMEVEVNCRMPELVGGANKKLLNQLLSAQMHRLLTLLDVYVETDCSMVGSDMPSEFSTRKLCPRLTKGRARLKPYKYNSRHKFQCY